MTLALLLLLISNLLFLAHHFLKKAWLIRLSNGFFIAFVLILIYRFLMAVLK